LNQIESAREGLITPEMERVALSENLPPDQIRRGVADGSIVILHSGLRRHIKPVGVGSELRTKVSASIGLYGPDASIDDEAAKIEAALEAGTDSIMDLSVSGNIDGMLERTLALAATPVGTLPLYQALTNASSRYGTSTRMEVEELFDVIERQAASGVDFLALHSGLTMEIVEEAKRSRRLDPLVSYGGSHLIGWMLANKKENPLYEGFDRILEIAAKNNVVLSLADGMRPGCLHDSLDTAQVQELVMLGKLVERARAAGVQVMIKGPGHVPLNLIQTTVELQKRLCGGAPYFVFGPVVTDLAVGFDHIGAAIGGALSAWAGADFICYVTAAEHAGLPDVKQVREGVVAARIAAHAADLASGLQGSADWDKELSKARKSLDWKRQIELAIDPRKAAQTRQERSGEHTAACAMCGKYCAMKVVSEYLGNTIQSC